MYKRFVIVLLVAVAIYFLYDSLNSSYAYQYHSDYHYKLFYDEDISSLNDNVYRYVSDIDDDIMVTATYEDSSELFQNYSFLTNFAIKYILSHNDLFVNDIISKEDYKYINSFGEEKSTNDYVSVDVIYDVTDWFFGIRDYYIEDNLLLDGYVPLRDLSISFFTHTIRDVNSYIDGEYVKSDILYSDGSKYLYSFYVVNNVLKIKNVEVVL